MCPRSLDPCLLPLWIVGQVLTSSASQLWRKSDTFLANRFKQASAREDSGKALAFSDKRDRCGQHIVVQSKM